MFIWTFFLRITHTIISQSSADSSWITLYFLSAVGLTPGDSNTLHIYTHTVQRTTQLCWEVCRPGPIFVSYTLAFALQLREKNRKTSVRIAEECQLARWKQNVQNRAYIAIGIHKHNNNNNNNTQLTKSFIVYPRLLFIASPDSY